MHTYTCTILSFAAVMYGESKINVTMSRFSSAAQVPCKLFLALLQDKHLQRE